MNRSRPMAVIMETARGVAMQARERFDLRGLHPLAPSYMYAERASLRDRLDALAVEMRDLAADLDAYEGNLDART